MPVVTPIILSNLQLSEHVNLRGGHLNKNIPVEKMRTLRLHRKDFKKGGEALRGKNVAEGYRIKEKDMKRTMKWRLPNEQPPQYNQHQHEQQKSKGTALIKKIKFPV